jgi:hypothetical protein
LGQLITHFGFLKESGQTQGLQLNEWFKDLDLELELSILECDAQMVDYLPILELAFAKKLKPILGKHR